MVSVVAVAAVLVATFAVAMRVGRHSVIDVAWGIGFAVVALATALLSIGQGDAARTWLVCALTVVWGLRLALHIGRRSAGKGEDPRYARLLSKAPGNRTAYAVRSIYLLQGAILLAISMPVQVAGYSQRPLGLLALVGVTVWAIGLLFEAVGDAQLARFKADPRNKGAIMDRGLWSWTRHPNYFGDACVWWGIFLVAAEAWPGVLTIYAPVVMTLLLTKGSGQRILEAHMRDRPGWADYARRTSGFFPLPPKKAGTARR
ncbi:DUF1295 domain-containing protein [Nocardiopsis ansamitocini]|nr:DUF1295 domain-containing protein [Nocardiopsis ansamitocini]